MLLRVNSLQEQQRQQGRPKYGATLTDAPTLPCGVRCRRSCHAWEHLSTAHPVPASAKAPPIPQPRLGLFHEGVGSIQTGKQPSGMSREYLSCELLRS